MDQKQIAQTLMKNVRIPAYCVMIFTCSLLNLSEDYKVEKTNILNQWFVKLGWFWTSSLVLTLLLLSIRDDDKESVSKAMFKVIVSTAIWYISVSFFQYVDSTTGFDISGHTFILVFSNLLITSELKLFTAIEPSRKRFVHVQTFKILLLALSILWDFMLLQTALYYHTMLQKMIAAIWAISSWYTLHLLFYIKPKPISQ